MVFGLFMNHSLLRQNNITDMNIYFYDPMNAVRFIPSKFKIKEEKFIDKFETVFSLKTRVTEKHEDYENCKVYKKGEYESCLQSEIQGSFSNIMNCTPPWFTSDPKQVNTTLIIS